MIPTQRPMDGFGSGEFGAPRAYGKHNGVDIVGLPGSPIVSLCAGKLTKIGYPYDPKDPVKGFLRYIQVTRLDGLRFRYFYASTRLEVGRRIEIGQIIGALQNVSHAYDARMLPHLHFEVIDTKGKYLDPNQFF